MKKILLFTLILTTLAIAGNSDKEQKARVQKQLKIDMEKEAKYSREQTFYQGKNYDLKGAEVNEETVKNINRIQVNDMDMDDVYD